jgi:F-type H+-transporting ATPase subunit delta
MPLTESQPDAISMTYAASLFDLAMGRGGREKAEGLLAQLEDVLELARTDARFGEFLASQIVASDRRGRSLGAIFQGRADDLVVKFLQILNERDRLSILPAVVQSYDSLCQQRFGRVEVDVFTADPMTPDAAAALRQRLESSIGRQVVMHPYVDNQMIGGVKLRIGDQLVDASLATRLRRMGEKIATEGRAILRSRPDTLSN